MSSLMRPALRFLLANACIVASLGAPTGIDVTVGYSAADLVDKLIGGTDTGITVVSSNLVGNEACAGIFSNAKNAVGWFSNSGIVLSSGSPGSLHMQDEDDQTVCFSTPGDSYLDTVLAPVTTRDACVLEIEFTVDDTVKTIEFSYVFGSDEYTEFAGTKFTDAFALLLNGENLALIPGTTTPVSINTINHATHSEFYNENDMSVVSPVPYPGFEADGFTDRFVAAGPVVEGTNTLKFAIADASDCEFDSWVLLDGDSLRGSGDDKVPATTPPQPTPAPTHKPTPAPTTKSGGAKGDPHVKTWAGLSFDFHGGCDLMLVKNPGFANGLGLQIQIRTKIETWWSYIESAVVQIGDHTIELQGGSDGGPHFWVNGLPGNDVVENDETLQSLQKELEVHLPGFMVHYKRVSSKQHKFRIDLNYRGDAISLETYKDWVAVNVKAGKTETFAGATGLMGSYPSGAMVGRNGAILTDTDAFGQEWQVLESEPNLFHSLEGVQHPTKCAMPSESLQASAGRRRLGSALITAEDAAFACSRVDLEDRDACIFDVLATNDKDVAGSY